MLTNHIPLCSLTLSNKKWAGTLRKSTNVKAQVCESFFAVALQSVCYYAEDVLTFVSLCQNQLESVDGCLE